MAAEDTGKGQPPLHTPNKRRVWQTQSGPSSEKVLEGGWGSAGFPGTWICSTAEFPCKHELEKQLPHAQTSLGAR